jgi:hypothetical protein
VQINIVDLPTSTDSNETEGKSEASEIPEQQVSFETVKDLLDALNKNPDKYNHKEVYVKGTLCKCEEDGGYSAILALVDINEPLPSYNGVELRYQIKNNPSINIKITDDTLYSLAKHNEYMMVGGFVRISDGKLYLDDCIYTTEYQPTE